MTADRPAHTLRWDPVMQFLHWAMALLVVAQIALGWMASTWELSPTKLDLFVWHKSTGVLVLALVVVRAAWRATHRRPTWPADMTPFERHAAALTHALLYLLLVLLPLTGWLVNSASGVPFAVFWALPLPSLVEPDKAMADVTARIHLGLSVALVVLLLLHVSAALIHHYARRDDVLAGMLPRGKATPP